MATLPDFPAAHSMDTTWFAVDADGFVGEFDSGEGGAVPLAATATAEGGEYDALPLYEALAARAEVALSQDEIWERDRDVGLYRFDGEYEEPGRYARRAAPAKPLNVSELPLELQEPLRALAFPVRFAEREHLHLADHMPDAATAMWSPDATLRGTQPPASTSRSPSTGSAPPAASTPSTSETASASTSGRLIRVVVTGVIIALVVYWLTTR